VRKNAGEMRTIFKQKVHTEWEGNVPWKTVRRSRRAAWMTREIGAIRRKKTQWRKCEGVK
jgi:hypothetical protein